MEGATGEVETTAAGPQAVEDDVGAGSGGGEGELDPLPKGTQCCSPCPFSPIPYHTIQQESRKLTASMALLPLQ